jgi:beta-mannosidase
MAAADIDDASWPTMQLPSSWFLLGKKQYPAKATAMRAPFGENAPGELWPVDPDSGLDYAGTVWFRHDLDWQAGRGNEVILDLDMVDYYAEVFVNGVSVGHHEGYFQRWSVDATRALHAGKNVIALKVSAPPLVFDMAQQYAVSWPKMQNQIKGIFAYHDTRPGATSPRGQERSTGGVLRGVGLHESTGVDLEDVTVTPLDVSATSARLVIDATLHNWTDAPRDVALDGVIRGSNFDDPSTLPVRASGKASPGVSHLVTEVTVDHPRLWWSWDYGRPNLYELTAHIAHDGGDDAPRSARFGVRSITRDDHWVVRLNGQRVYPRGTNYIATQWLSQADREFYARDERLMIEAELNSVRVHAHLERPEFYDLADELGIMVWQDFPLQWGYTDLPAFHAEAVKQAEDMVRQYGNHPSIVLWSMHNESPYAMAWMKHRDPDQNRALDESLAAVARKLDPSRIVHRDSGTGDGHYYYGWYDGALADVATAKVEPMITEYGASSLPEVATLRTMFDAKTLWPSTPGDWETWKFADFQPKNTFTLAKIKQGKDLAEFVRNTQRYQAVLVRYSTEVFRRRKWGGSTGLYQFMFTDDWPSVTWSVVDYYRRPKLGYAALQASMRQLLASIEYDPNDPKKPLAIHVVNDHVEAFPGARVAWKVTRDGKALSAGERVLDLPGDGVVKVSDLGSVPAVGQRGGLLSVTVSRADGKELAHATLEADDFVQGASK